jgi:altronate dehydratase small subunit
MELKGALMMSEKDNVATALAEAEQGSEVEIRLGKETRDIKALDEIPFGFKIAVADIPAGSAVYKYGEQIGVASKDIKQGQLVHIHNIEGARARGDRAKGASK